MHIELDHTAAEVSEHGTPGWRFAVAAGILGWILDAFDFFVVVFLITELMAKFQVGKGAIVWTMTLTLAMRPIGALIFGTLADEYGRKRPLIACVLYFSVVTMLSALAPTYWLFLAARLLYGLGMGGYWGIGASYAMESAPRKKRGFLSGMMQGGYPFGYLMASIAIQTIAPAFGWQAMFFVGFPVALLIVVLTLFAPESVAWELHKTTSLKKIFGTLFEYKGVFSYLLLVMMAMNCLSHGTQDLYPDFLKTLPWMTGATVLGMKANLGIPVLYVNQVGGNDDLVFDGRSCAFDSAGNLIARARAFEEDLVVVDLAAIPGEIVPPDNTLPEEEVWQALVLGTRDDVRKCGFERVLLGLSGGIDSSLTAAIAAEALGPENVLGVLMPSPFTSRDSIEDAVKLVQNLGIRTLTLPITGIMQAFENALQGAFSGRERDVTEENIQARIRGNLMMALSNKFGSLLLTTGNKSEIAVGYCTLYGDMSGGLAVISDVPKTMVYRLVRWFNRTAERIPDRVLSKAPSAELRPNQTDQDTLPAYDLLDEVLQHHIEHHESAAEIMALGLDARAVRQAVRGVRGAEFKRKQAAPGIKVTDQAFGTGWRMPVARADWENQTKPAKLVPE